MDDTAKQEQIENWIRIGLSQPEEKISEVFYFDRRDNQFFSILVSDYFHFDENYKTPENAISSYSQNILHELADRMKRIENDDKSIIPLSRTKKDEDISIEYLNQKMEEYLNLNSIDIETATIWEVDQVGSLSIDLTEKDAAKPKIMKSKSNWWEFWK